jgi:GNAT superfamily N-acetyltransferase
MASLPDFFAFTRTSLGRIDPSEVDTAVDLINSAYRYQDAAKGRPRTDATRLAEKISESEFYVARRGRETVACVYVERGHSNWHFGLLTVTEPLRGTGLGAALIQSVEQYARTENASQLDLDYMSLAPWLKAYYERFGFTETGQIAPWGTITLVRMSKPLT